MNLLEYLHSKLNADDYNWLVRIKKQFNHDVSLNLSRDVTILISIIEIHRDRLYAELDKIRATKKDNYIIKEEADIIEKAGAFFNQIQFLRDPISKLAENWESIYSEKSKVDPLPEAKNNDDELQEFKNIIDQLHRDIIGIEKQRRNEFIKLAASKANIALGAIEKYITALKKIDSPSNTIVSFIPNWEVNVLTGKGNPYRTVAGRLFDLIEPDFKEMTITQKGKDIKFTWGRNGFIKKMEKV